MGLKERLEHELGARVPQKVIEDAITNAPDEYKGEHPRTTSEVSDVKGKGAEFFVEALAEEAFKREMKEYVEAYVELKVNEAFAKLFQARDKESANLEEKFCNLCGNKFKVGSDTRFTFCEDCRELSIGTKTSRMAGHWRWLMRRFPTLGVAVLKEKGKEDERNRNGARDKEAT